MNLISAEDARAQRQYDRWYFGFRAGLDFTTSPPTLTADGQTMTIEGSASYCDPKTGAVLFYTDGVMVWDRLHRLMANGRDLTGDQSSTQGALIVPDPGDINRYYIFHCDQSGYVRPPKGAYYSIVDMRLSGGFGDVTTKNQLLLQQSTEKLTAIPVCGGEAYWIVGHEMLTNTFVAWYLDKNGVSQLSSKTSIGNNHGPLAGSGAGYLAASPNGLYLASAIAVPSSVEIFKFNSESGQLQDRILLPFVAGAYGVSFSPDNSKVYVSGTKTLTQFDLTVWDSATIAKSRFHVFSDLIRREGALKLGPDGKLYVQEVTHLGVIANPNASGASCNYTPGWLRLRMPSQFGLPNNIDALAGQGCKIPIARIARHETLICEESCTSFKDSSRFAPTSWIWQFEGGTPSVSLDKDPKNICYAKAGDYQVKLIVSNEHGVDSTTSTIRVKTCPIPVVSLRDTTLCISECATFKDTSTLATSWRWTFEEGQPASHPGRTPPPVCYYRPGKHKVTLTATNQYGSATAVSYVTVKDCNLPIADLTHDTSICSGENVHFTDRSRNVVLSREWLFEGGMPSMSSDQHPKNIFYQTPGFYRVRLIANNAIGSDTAFSSVRVRECASPVAKLQDYTLCEGDCIWLQDSSTGDPVYWEWLIEGGSFATSLSKTPGRVCFSAAGQYKIRLISTNAYGSDTANATVTVTSSKAQPIASLGIAGIAACTQLDTAIWINAGCRDVALSAITSSLPSVVIGSYPSVVKANGSVRLPVSIVQDRAGTYASTISLLLDGVADSLACTYSVLKAPESFGFAFDASAFLAKHCSPTSRVFKITNNACSEQRIRNARILSNSVSTPFFIDASGGSIVGRVIQPSEELALTITYDPTLAGSTETELVIETQDGAKETWALRGVRGELPRAEIVLHQPADTYLEQGDEFDVALAFGTGVGDSAAPEQIDLTMQYNTDVISLKESLGTSGWSVLDRSELNGSLTMRLVRARAQINANDTLARLRFRSYLAIEDSTSISLSSIACNGGDIDFANCTLSAVANAGGSITVGAGCGDQEIRKAMSGIKTLSVVVQPNPASRIDGFVRLRVQSTATEIAPIALAVDIVDVQGKTITTINDVQLTSIHQDVLVDLKDVPAGSYTIRTSAAGESASSQLVVY